MSQSAIEVLYGRFAMHICGMRDDCASVALINELPTTSYLAYWLVKMPLWLSWKFAGALNTSGRCLVKGS